jgi:type VI secretion system secreted protein Hcp
MAVEMFLDLGTCKGESIAKGHEDQVDILAWNWGVANQGSGHLGGGSGTGKASFHDLTVTKYVDKATNTILENCAKGKHFTKASLFCRKVGGDSPLEYLEIEMDQVFVSGVQHGGSLGDELTTETVTLNFEKVNVKYKPQSATGSAAGDVPFKWDIRKNEAA